MLKLVIIGFLFLTGCSQPIYNKYGHFIPQQRPPAKGLSFRAEGIMPISQAAKGFGMYGYGLDIRYRPVNFFAVSLGIDYMFGVDYNGFNRKEIPLSLNGIFYIPNKSLITPYIILGGNYSNAKVRSTLASPLLSKTDEKTDEGLIFGDKYSYLGGQNGLGIALGISKNWSLDLDNLMFIRHRIDDGPNPEFSDPKTGQDTKDSLGFVTRGSISFWW